MKYKSWIYLILFIFSFILSVSLNYDKINIKYFGGLYKSVWVDVIYNENNDLKLINIDNVPYNTLKISDNHYLYKTNIFKKVKKISVQNRDKIENITIYVDKKIQFDNFEIDNSKTISDRFSIIILSFFYNFQLYLFSYLFLFLFLHNFKGRINCFWIILFLSIIFRLTQINSIPFWDDEIYVLKVTSNYSPLIELFKDPGNPPLYFILFKIYKSIVQNPDFYRFSSVITGVAFLVIFYFYIKKPVNTKTALTGLFFAGFSIALIYFSQEIRCYMLLALLAVLTSLFLFKRKKAGYLISSILLLYTHFYGVFYVLYNFIFSIFYFKKEKKDFIILNLIALFSFVPFAIYKMVTLASDFNSWIKVPKLINFIQVINIFSGNLIIFLIFLILLTFVYKKSSKRTRLFINYNVLAIVFITLMAVIFSYLIKPVFMYRYFYIVYPSYIALCAVLTKDIKLNIFVFLLFISQGLLGYQNLYCNHNLYLDFINHNIDKTKKNYIFMSDTTEGYREFLIKETKPVYIKINTGLDTINPDDYKIEKPSVCYILNLYLDDKTFNEAKHIELYKTPLGVFSKVEY